MSAPDRGTRVVTVAAVLLVAGIAAIVSYSHMQHVAERAGEGWRSHLIPLSIDGLIVAASMVLVDRRRAGRPGGWLAWTALLGGVGASLAANVAAAEPTTTARLVAAWPAVAFAIGFELLLQQRRATAESPGGTAEPAPHGHTTPVAAVVEPAQPDTADLPGDGHTTAAPADEAELEARARELIAAADGKPPGRRALARQLGVSEHQARAWLAATNGGDRR